MNDRAMELTIPLRVPGTDRATDSGQLRTAGHGRGLG